MSGPRYSRRAVAVGGGIAVALGLTALGVTVPRLLHHRYRPSPNDDLFAYLVDRDAAVRVGKAVIFAGPNDVGTDLAAALRHRLKGRTLADVTHEDLAKGLLVEAKGWVLPATVGFLAMLAAQES
jgi:hypothetical protein